MRRHLLAAAVGLLGCAGAEFDLEDAAGPAVDAGGMDGGAAADGGGSVPPRLDFGYYRADRVPSGGASSFDTVKGWTNLAYLDWNADARAFDVPEGGDMTQVKANMAALFQRATSAGLVVMMDVAYGTAWGPRLTKGGILEVAAPYWASVKYVMLGDELELTLADAQAVLAEWRTGVANYGLEARPIGVTLTQAYLLSNPQMLQAGWDYIAVEAYTPTCACGTCGTGTEAQEIAAVAQQMNLMEATVPATVDLVAVLQGYDRNGAFADKDVLAAINRATWFDMVKGDPRYVAMTIFAWDREGSTCAQTPYPTHGHGSSGLPGVQAAHQEIWLDLTAP